MSTIEISSNPVPKRDFYFPVKVQKQNGLFNIVQFSLASKPNFKIHSNNWMGFWKSVLTMHFMGIVPFFEIPSSVKSVLGGPYEVLLIGSRVFANIEIELGFWNLLSTRQPLFLICQKVCTNCESAIFSESQMPFFFATQLEKRTHLFLNFKAQYFFFNSTKNLKIGKFQKLFKSILKSLGIASASIIGLRMSSPSRRLSIQAKLGSTRPMTLIVACGIRLWWTGRSAKTSSRC